MTSPGAAADVDTQRGRADRRRSVPERRSHRIHLPTWASGALAIAVAGVCSAALMVAAASPLLEWRTPVYIAAGFAGIIGLVVLLVQPLLVLGVLPRLGGYQGRRLHLWSGWLLIVLIVVHVGGLWIVSPPDVIDALVFASPTPFSVWGVIAMWAAFVAAGIVMLRYRLPLAPRTWRLVHAALALTVVGGTVIHAVLIEGAMGTGTKMALSAAACLAAVAAAAILVRRVRARS
ncbi:MAG: ferric reductase [Pseudomonadota bacterium]